MFFRLARRTCCAAAVATAVALPAGADGLPVQLVVARHHGVTTELQVTGTIDSHDSLALGFRQAGRVVEVLVEEGDRVVPGTVMARLDPVQQQQALNAAKAALTAATASEAQARQADDRAAALLDRGVGTRTARDAATEALSAAVGAVQQAEAGVQQAQRALRDTELRAPQQAVVTARDLAPGQIVGAAQPVLSLATVAGLEARFAVPDSPVLDDAMGQTVRLATIDISRDEMTGTVTDISPLVDPGTGTVALEVAIEGTAGDISLLGAAVRGTVRIPGPDVIAVPWNALMRDADQAAVWAVDRQSSTVELIPVTISHFDDNVVYLSGGLADGQVIVAAGSQLLYPGRRVADAADPDGSGAGAGPGVRPGERR